MRIIQKIVVLLAICCIPVSAYSASLNVQFEDMMEFDAVEMTLAPVSVALIDTGIETVYLDGERVMEGENYVSDQGGDLVGHGTRIASLMIGAKDEDGYISDLAPNAFLVPLVYYSKYPSGVPMNGGVEAICSGIYDAVDQYGCSVIIISSGMTQPDGNLEKAVLYAEEKGVIIISAAGNEGNAVSYYPASYPTVIGVGSVDENKEASEFSQRNEGVMIAAPGEDLFAVSIRSGIAFEKISGTSYACAYVGALASRLLGVYPDMTPTQFRWVMQNTATDLGAFGYDAETGVGLLNAKKAVEEFEVISKTEPLPFYDVSLSSWFYDSVRNIYKAGLMNGITETTFAPNTNITRAMLATILYRLEGEPAIWGGLPFTDVEEGSYYEFAVAWAKQSGIVNGVSETEFAPADSITREQIAAMIHRYAQYKGYDVSVGENTNILSYDDFADISEYAIASVQYACGSGLMKGKTESTLNTKDNATRAEMAAILHRFIEANE